MQQIPNRKLNLTAEDETKDITPIPSRPSKLRHDRDRSSSHMGPWKSVLGEMRDFFDPNVDPTLADSVVCWGPLRRAVYNPWTEDYRSERGYQLWDGTFVLLRVLGSDLERSSLVAEDGATPTIYETAEPLNQGGSTMVGEKDTSHMSGNLRSLLHEVYRDGVPEDPALILDSTIEGLLGGGAYEEIKAGHRTLKKDFPTRRWLTDEEAQRAERAGLDYTGYEIRRNWDHPHRKWVISPDGSAARQPEFSRSLAEDPSTRRLWYAVATAHDLEMPGRLD
jgi:hypothetical protein